MATRNGSARWTGDLKTGSGELTVGEGAWTSAYSGRSRFAGVLPGFEHGEGTNPEELPAAAHAACFSMALSLALSDAGHPPSSINTTAHVHLRVVDGAPAIQQIDLNTEADVPGLDQKEFPGPRAAGEEGKAMQLRLSELFAPGKDSLIIYNFMFPRGYKGPRPGPASGETALLPLEEGPCPSCVALLDQLDGAAGHVSQRLNLAVVAKTSLPRLLTVGNERGWRHLRLLSSAGNTYNRDYLGEDGEEWQVPMLNVFHRDGAMIRHFWGAELTYAPADPGQDHRSVGTLEPLWNLFDLTREGRPMDWDEQLSYP